MASSDRIVVVGAGAEAEVLRSALTREGASPEPLAGHAALDPGLARAAALVVEATPDADIGAKARAVGELLDILPGHAPIAVATRRHPLAALLPALGHGARVVGLHVVRTGGTEEASGGRPVVAELAMPASVDDAVVDAVLALLTPLGFVALPCADAPGRIVDRLVVAAWLEARAAAAAGTPWDTVAAALAEAGIDLAAVDEAALATVAAGIHAGLGAPARFEPRPVAHEARAPLAPTLRERLALTVIAEAYRLVEEAVAGAEEIERATTAGARWTAGPFTLAGRRGLRGVVTALAAISRDPDEDAAARDRFGIPRLLWTMATV